MEKNFYNDKFMHLFLIIHFKVERARFSELREVLSGEKELMTHRFCLFDLFNFILLSIGKENWRI